MKVVLLGGPGAGKGTQAKYLCDAFHLTYISTGDLLRDEIAAGSNFGQQIQTQVDHGELVADERMIDLIRDRLQPLEINQGWVLDGYPRTAFQAEELDFLLADLNQRLDFAISIAVPDFVLLSRSGDRARSDDTPEALQRRIQLFIERTIPLLEYYEMRGCLIQINGNQLPDDVRQEIIRKIKG